MKLAAVDIGSNAIRLQVTTVIQYNNQISFKKLEYVRFPLRLGQDVFTTKSISPRNEAKFMKLMHAFKLLIELYEVDDYMACATSAMRESKNGQEIVRKVNEAFGLKINIIDGSREAEIINRAFSSKLDDKKYLHIDVGGGSTELILYINKQQIMAKSFKIGSVRRLGHHESPQVFKKMTDWVEENVRQKFGNVIAIGTGGNINKVLELAKKKSGKFITLEKIEEVQKYVAGFSLEERVNFLQLNPDRADVIIPASEIYTAVMRSAKAKKILVPDVGLKDGMMQIMYERNLKKMKDGATKAALK